MFYVCVTVCAKDSMAGRSAMVLMNTFRQWLSTDNSSSNEFQGFFCFVFCWVKSNYNQAIWQVRVFCSHRLPVQDSSNCLYKEGFRLIFFGIQRHGCRTLQFLHKGVYRQVFSKSTNLHSGKYALVDNRWTGRFLQKADTPAKDLWWLNQVSMD